MPDPITLALLLTAGVGGSAAWAAGRREQLPVDQLADGGPVTLTPGVEHWRSLVIELAGAAGQPPEFHMAWIARESGGNPAAVGSIHATAPENGYAREIGLYQLYNPDEVKLTSITPAQLRAGAAAPTGTQSLVRALTDEEERWQVQAGVDYIAKRKAAVDALLARYSADWNATDTWRLVKLYHAVSGLPPAVFAAGFQTYGRALADWAELVSVAQSTDLTPWGGKNLAAYAPYGNYAAKRGPLPNAEAVGGVVQS